MNTTASPRIACPLCGGANVCGVAATGDPQAPCWCRDVTFTPETLARIPDALRGKACLCPACANAGAAGGDAAITSS